MGHARPGTGARSRPGPAAAPAGNAPPATLDPFAKMKPQAGTFDLRTIDDGQPAANMRSGRGKAALIASIIVGLVGFALGAGMGMAGVGRANMNTANHAAKTVKAELDGMQKTLTQIGTAVAMSQQRMAADEEGHAQLRPAADQRPREDQARPAARHQQDLPRRLLPPGRRRRRSAVQLLLRQHRAL